MYYKDLLSGALITSIVERAKDFTIKRAIDVKSSDEGVSREDIIARRQYAEFKENEIFPKTDTQEDWLKLLDYEPENVVNVKPIRPGRARETAVASRRDLIKDAGNDRIRECAPRANPRAALRR